MVQVTQALAEHAVAVLASIDDTSGRSFGQRYAAFVLSGQMNTAQLTQVVRAVGADGVTTTGASDAAVLARVSAIWPQLAGF